jgi:hypothetical protein
MAEPMPTGRFTCNVVLRRIRPPEFTRDVKNGVTYLIARGYEIAYETALRFSSGAQLPIKARLIGELNQRIVIRDASGRPTLMTGYVQGVVEIKDLSGQLIFHGRYYDSRTIQGLAGDDAFTPVGPSTVDHWENGFGEGSYAGHAFSMGIKLTREGDGPLRGEAQGQID